jgi:tight adherence protein B
VTGLIAALMAAAGVYLCWTNLALGWTGWGLGPQMAGATRRRTVADRMASAGLGDVRPGELAVATAVLLVGGWGVAWVLFGGTVVPALVGMVSAGTPVAAARRRRQRQLESAREAWPRLIEEIRLATGSLGRSLPQALVALGPRGPEELRPAFAAAQREWFLTTDFSRTVAVLKAELADPTADVVCETLLVAHELGGTDVDRRLQALAEDRTEDLQQRRDARARQAGARFARRFVIGVPVGMAVAGLSIGDGRAAFASAPGQAAVVVAVVLMAVCWVWAGRTMRLPDEERVLR